MYFYVTNLHFFYFQSDINVSNLLSKFPIDNVSNPCFQSTYNPGAKSIVYNGTKIYWTLWTILVYKLIFTISIIPYLNSTVCIVLPIDSISLAAYDILHMLCCIWYAAYRFERQLEFECHSRFRIWAGFLRLLIAFLFAFYTVQPVVYNVIFC